MSDRRGDPPTGEDLFGPPPAGQAKKLSTAELSGIRRRLMLKRDAESDLGPMLEGREACRELWESWRGLLQIEKRTYVLDVGALLEDRHRLLEELAAQRRVAVAAEAVLREDGRTEQARLVDSLRQALAAAGYDTRPRLIEVAIEATPSEG